MADNLSFEKANQKLEKLVKELESGNLSLEESMQTYEKAFGLLAFCYDKLENYKGQIIDINSRIDAMKKEELFND